MMRKDVSGVKGQSSKNPFLVECDEK
jgi:hypothetical protein